MFEFFIFLIFGNTKRQRQSAPRSRAFTASLNYNIPIAQGIE